VPIVAAVEGRREFTGRLYVGIGIQRVRDLIRVRLVDAVERQGGEARGLGLVEIGIRHEVSTQDSSENQ
jgi:hypothetical protein